MKIKILHIQRKALFILCSVAMTMSIVNYTFASSHIDYNHKANKSLLMKKFLRKSGDRDEIKFVHSPQHDIVVETQDERSNGVATQKYSTPVITEKNISTIEEEKVASLVDGISSQAVHNFDLHNHSSQHAIAIETQDEGSNGVATQKYSTPVITEKNINTIEEGKVDSKEDGVSNQVVKDFDLSSDISCGNWKCFVPSLSDKDIGYLVMRDTSNSTIMNIGWTVAKEIEANYGAMHLYLDAPYTAELSSEIRMKLNTIVVFEAFDGFGEDFFKLSSVIVQKMKKSPKDALFFGCFGQNFDTYLRYGNNFIWDLGESKIPGKIDTFLKNIKESYDIVKKVVTARPILLHDFQAIIDTEGHLFFIDLDGHVNWRPNRWSKDHPKSGAQCLHTLLDLQHGAETCKNIMDTRALKRKKRRMGVK